MSAFIAALPMYDWPEAASDTDAAWQQIRTGLAEAGIDAPVNLTRQNGDMPAVPGGIRDTSGRLLAPDPATLPPDELDLFALWHHPQLLLGQTCWGPLSQGLGEHVVVVGQPDYSAFSGGSGPLYSSAIIMRKGDAPAAAAPKNNEAFFSVEILRGRRFVFNSRDSMSGLLALTQDLEAGGKDLSIFSEKLETGGHRLSLRAVAEGRADVCACDCRSWALMQRFERDTASRLDVVGWTAKRPGLPFIMAPNLRRHEAAVRTAIGMADL